MALGGGRPGCTRVCRNVQERCRSAGDTPALHPWTGNPRGGMISLAYNSPARGSRSCPIESSLCAQKAPMDVPWTSSDAPSSANARQLRPTDHPCTARQSSIGAHHRPLQPRLERPRALWGFSKSSGPNLSHFTTNPYRLVARGPPTRKTPRR